MKIKNFQLNNPKVYYIIGALRDGCLTSQWTIKIKQKNKKWLSNVLIPLFIEIFERRFKNNIYFQNDGTSVWYLAFKDKEIWKVLDLLKIQSPKNKEEEKFYISGFWDSDGGCPKKPCKNKKLYIKFTQKDKKSLETLKEIIEKFDIKCGKIRISENNKNGIIWRFTITNKQGMLNFCKNIGSYHPEKKNRLLRMEDLLSAR